MVDKRVVVLATRDITPATSFIKLANELQNTDSIIQFMADEGSRAEEVFTKAGHSLLLEIPNDIDVLIVGCSTPGTYESALLDEAERMNALGTHDIKKVVYIDIVGAHRRLGSHQADLYLASNGACVDALLEDDPDAEHIIVGESNAVYAQASDKGNDPRTKIGDCSIITWAAQLTTSELELIVASMMLMPGSVLIMGLHPDPNKWPDAKRIEEIIAPLKAEGRVYTSAELGINTDTSASFSNYVVGAYTGALIKAVYNGNKVVCVATPEVLMKYGEECPGSGGGLPLVALGCAPLVTKPCNFGELEFPDISVVRRKLVPLDFSEAVEVIISL